MILIISAVFPPDQGTSAYITYELAIALSDTREVKVLTPKPTRPLRFSFHNVNLRKNKFEQIILNSYTCPEFKLFGRIKESYSFGRHASEYIKKNRSEIDGIYINAWPMLAQYSIAKSAKKYSLPSIIQIDDIYPESLATKIPVIGNLLIKLLLPMDKFILHNVSKILVISEEMRDILVESRKIQEDKIEVIHNWQDETEFIRYHENKKSSIKSDYTEKPFSFMYLGNIGPVAGVEFLIESFVKAKLKNALLIIAGAGSMKDQCIRIAASYKNKNIHFKDVPNGMVPEIQDEADVMLLPVKKGAAMSSIPSKVIAYMFSKKPVIACVDDGSDTSKTIENAKCGWILPPENEDFLAAKMVSVVSLPRNELNNIGMNGFLYAMDNLSKKKNLEKMINIISNVI